MNYLGLSLGLEIQGRSSLLLQLWTILSEEPQFGSDHRRCCLLFVFAGLYGPKKDLESQGPMIVLGCSGDLVSRLCNGPHGACNGLLWWLVGDTKWTYQVN